MKLIKTDIQRNSGISLAILLICLCLGSLVVMPMISAFSLSVQETSQVGGENNDPSNQPEFDEEFLFETIVGIMIAHPIFSRFGPINLGVQTASIAPVSPPPQYT